MKKAEKKALKARLRRGLKFHKDELKKMNKVIVRWRGLKKDRVFKAAFSNIKADIRLYKRLNSKVR